MISLKTIPLCGDSPETQGLTSELSCGAGDRHTEGDFTFPGQLPSLTGGACARGQIVQQSRGIGEEACP